MSISNINLMIPYPIFALACILSLGGCSNKEEDTAEKDLSWLIVRCSNHPAFNEKYKLDGDVLSKEELKNSSFHQSISCECFMEVIEKHTEGHKSMMKLAKPILKETFASCVKEKLKESG